MTAKLGPYNSTRCLFNALQPPRTALLGPVVAKSGSDLLAAPAQAVMAPEHV
jgi:hypothetical protein